MTTSIASPPAAAAGLGIGVPPTISNWPMTGLTSEVSPARMSPTVPAVKFAPVRSSSPTPVNAGLSVSKDWTLGSKLKRNRLMSRRPMSSKSFVNSR